MEQNSSNKNILTVAIALVLGLVVGYLMSGSMNVNNQSAQSISSDAGKGVSRQGGIKSDDEVSPRIDSIVRDQQMKGIRVYDLMNQDDAAEFFAKSSPYAGSIEDFPNFGNPVELPVTCEYSEFGNYVYGWSTNSGQAVGQWGDASSLMRCYISFGGW